MVLPSKELLIAIGLDVNIHTDLYYDGNVLVIHNQYQEEINVNIYELMHMNLKEWAKINKVFDKIDWSVEPEDIILKANEIYDELN